MVNAKRFPDAMPSPRPNKRRAVEAEEANQVGPLLGTSSSSWSDALLGAVFGKPGEISSPFPNANGKLPGKVHFQ
jgi:hypothetical protein